MENENLQEGLKNKTIQRNQELKLGNVETTDTS